ncbi:MAG: terminase family protein [Candidatus Coatesbacteria bacterium]
MKFRFPLLPWQVQARALRATRDLVVVNGGVHTGKTVWGAVELLADMTSHPGAVFWWVAGQRFQLEAMWTFLRPYFVHLQARIRQAPLLSATLPNGAVVYGVSAENLDAIASHHPLAIYGDEVAKWRRTAYDLVRLRLVSAQPTRGLFLSTPRPNFWREMVRWGREEKSGRWGLIHVPTPEAGLVTAQTIEAIREDLPDELFRQEILAELLEGGGNVFPRVREAATGNIEVSATGGCLIGYDPAKLRDFAVVLVRRGRRVIWVERWAKIPYVEQAARVAAMSRKFGNASIIIDAGGPGEAAAELLSRERGINVERITFTNELKERLVNANILRFEQGKIILPTPTLGPAYAALVDELTAFERRRTDAGLHYAYSAPDGEHDDCVSALLLAFCREDTMPGILAYYHDEAMRILRDDPAYRMQEFREKPHREAEYRQWLEEEAEKEKEEQAKNEREALADEAASLAEKNEE